MDRPKDDPAEADPALEPLPETDGGGGTTLDAPRSWDRPEDPPKLLFALPNEGGGGTTLAERELPEPPDELREVPAVLVEDTEGGGGTTSCVPKSFPMTLLRNDPLATCVGGGGTTVGEADCSRPLSRRCWSRASAEGGGAMTEGAGRLSLAVREESRCGADTGGGTTATLFI